MKAGFGLVALLLGVALMLFLIGGPLGGGGKSYIQTVTDVKKEKEPLVQQWGGRDPQGQVFHESLSIVAWPESGDLKGLEVVMVEPAGVAVTHFGLQQGDVITHIGQQDVGGFIINDEAAARDFLDTAYARGQFLTVTREGETVQLPRTGVNNQPPPAAGTPILPPGLPTGQ